ncbi:MAG: TIGR04063 family PEP-CTERM/XrtA system glycosyltransferase [Gammaproteobacteria bacterium]
MNPSSTPATGSQLPTPDGKPLRILHVLDHSVPLHSGYAFRTLAILVGQRDSGWETFQLTSPKQGQTRELQEQVGGWIFNRTPLATSFVSRVPVVKHWRLIQALKARLRDVVNATHPHILHAHSPLLNAFPALTVGREMGLPVVYEIRAFWEDAAADHGTATEWGLRYRLTRALETHVIRRADAVTTICEGLRTDLIARGIAAEKVTVIPNAVDINQFRVGTPPDRDLMEKYGLQSGFTLGFAGSFYAYEGLDVLLRAMPYIAEAIPQVRLLLVGGGPQESGLRTLAAELGMNDIAHFAGRVPHEEIARYYSVMDIMVYPRLPRRLTELVTPLKPLEAMALGKLVVASDVGGHRELIGDGKNGYLFAAGSVAALAQRLVSIIKDRASWESVIADGRRYVEHERNWSASVSRYRSVYARVLDRSEHTVEDRR